MRSEVDVLLDKIEDPVLRTDLGLQVQRLRARRTYGLVFETHLPERVRLPEHPIRVGARVVFRDNPLSPGLAMFHLTFPATRDRLSVVKEIGHAKPPFCRSFS
jgi:hypothetical protein